MATTFTLRQRLRYRFDNVFSRGAMPVLLLLVLALIVVFVIAALIQTLFSWGPADEQISFLEGFWLSFVRSLDPGTFSGDEGSHFRTIGVAITLLGVVAMAIIIGLVTTGLESRLSTLKQGRSLVVENNHTLILGSSLKIPAMVSELVEANASLRDAAIVVLTREPTDDLERSIRAEVRNLRTSRLVLRTGDPANVHDLATVNPAGARSVVVLTPDGATSDAATVKTVLAVVRLTEQAATPIVVEVQDRAISEAIRVATGGRAIVVVSSDIVGRLTAQVTRSSGLSAVYQELLDFSGDEIYMTPSGTVAGQTYGSALLAFATSTVIGLRAGDGTVLLNPAPDHVVLADDDLVLIAEDDDKIGTPSHDLGWDGVWAPRSTAEASHVESTLIIGWSHYVPTIATEIDLYVSAGSRLTLVLDPALAPNPDLTSMRLVNQELTVVKVDSLDLAGLEVIARAETYDHILIVCYRDLLASEDADARSLLTLMAVRQWFGGESNNVVTELLNVEAAELAAAGRPDDFVVSERLMSLVMTQLSENPSLATVFNDLLDSVDVSVRMRSWRTYSFAANADYATVVAAARAQGESAIGWRCASLLGHERDLGGGVFINPPKSLHASFADDDQIIVIG